MNAFLNSIWLFIKNAERARYALRGLSAWLFLTLLLSGTSSFAADVFVYSSGNNIYGVNLTSQQETFLTTASLSTSVNALASNSIDGLIYYGDASSIYYWDPALGTGPNSHALINNFENGFFQAPITKLDSAGGSFLNGKYYVGSEAENGFIQDVYELTMSADGRQMVSVTALDIHAACNCSEVQLGGFGDFTVVEESVGPVMYGSSADLTNNNQGTSAGIWRFELVSKSWTLLASGTGGQVAKGLDGRVFTNIGNSIRELNVSTGAISGQSLMNTSQAIWDFTGGFSYDFGDAPDSYGAATHLVDGAFASVFLGGTPPDNEPYSLHSGASGVDGSGDDQTGINDEDAFNSLVDINVGDSDYQVSVQCSGGFVSAWIDFNLNGTFDFIERNTNHPAQCLGQSADLIWSGFSVDAAGSSFARFRIAATAEDIYKPTGYVDNGEVEDHEITFTGSTTSSGNCPVGSVSYIYQSTDVPKTYSGTNANPTTSLINVPDSLVITDVNLLGVQATHDRQRRLYFLLSHAGRQLYLYGNTCNNNTAFDINFDDEASSNVACPPVSGQSYRPNNALSVFDGDDAQGDWGLQVYNFRRANSGALNNWALEICALGTVTSNPDIRIGKVAEVNGRSVTVTLLVKNTGNTPLSNVQIADNLDAVFGVGRFMISSAPQITSAPAGFTVNASYTGESSSSALLAGSGVLQVDEELELVFSVDVDYPLTPVNELYENQAIVNAIDSVGTSVDDVSGSGLDLTSDDDNPTQISMSSTLVISGVVFEDTSIDIQTSHDGIQQVSEGGVAGMGISVLDVATGVEIGTAITTADGSWTVSLDPQYTGQSVEVVVTPLSTTQFISESPLSVNGTITDGKVSVITQPNANSGSGVNFVVIGLIKRPTFVLDQTANVNAGAFVEYAHTYNATTHGNLEFSIEAVASSQSSVWIETVYRDFNCNAQVDGSDTILNGQLPVNLNETVCVVVRVEAPASSVAGESHQLKLNATFFTSDATATGHNVQFDNTVNDITTVVGESSGNLVLTKTVNNVSLGGLPVTQNSARPGHVLEYVIAYTNTGNGQINDLVINDEAPAFTQVSPASAQCSLTPQVMVCLPSTNGAQVQWSFQGSLPAGASGHVTYRVTVD